MNRALAAIDGPNIGYQTFGDALPPRREHTHAEPNSRIGQSEAFPLIAAVFASISAASGQALDDNTRVIQPRRILAETDTVAHGAPHDTAAEPIRPGLSQDFPPHFVPSFTPAPAFTPALAPALAVILRDEDVVAFPPRGTPRFNRAAPGRTTEATHLPGLAAAERHPPALEASLAADVDAAAPPRQQPPVGTPQGRAPNGPPPSQLATMFRIVSSRQPAVVPAEHSRSLQDLFSRL